MPTSVAIGPMVELLEQEWSALDQLCSPFEQQDWQLGTCLPGWTVQDQLAHVVGIEMMLQGVPAPDVDVSHLTHLRNDVGRMAEVWVESMRSSSGAAVLERFREVSAQRLDSLRSMSQADFDAPSWTPVAADETYGRFMRIRHFDCFMHEHDIRDAVGAPDRADPSAIASVLTEIEPGLGFMVGKRAALPNGSTVRLELTGPLERTYLVAVDGRARVVEQLSVPPTLTVRMPVMVFLRLSGGRADGVELVGVDVELEGDLELGRQLVANMAVTI